MLSHARINVSPPCKTTASQSTDFCGGSQFRTPLIPETMLLAKTGVSKAGYLLKRSSTSSWRSSFILLNDHCIFFSSEKNNFEKPDGHLLLTAGTRVYQQDDETAVIRLETGFDCVLLKAKDEAEAKEWKRAVHANVGRLAELARGQCRVKSGRGRTKECFLLLHRACITIHPSLSDLRHTKVYPLTNSSSFHVHGESIEFKSGAKCDEALMITPRNGIEHQHWCYALGVALTRLKKDASKTVVPPPHWPVLSGGLLCMDPETMQWRKVYITLTEDSLYVQAHRQVGQVKRYLLTPNAMIFTTTFRAHSFELVLFSDSIHLCATSSSERGEWIHCLEQLVPRSRYDESDPLQVASLERQVEIQDADFHSESDAGLMLERRGNWAIAALVSESLSRKVCQGSVLAKVANQSVLLVGFDSVVSTLSYWQPPLQLCFLLSPRKMGWLNLMVKERTSWIKMLGNKRKSADETMWERVYATLSSGVLTLFSVKRDGKSTKRAFSMYGSYVALVDSSAVSGHKHCFRVLDGTEAIVLQCESQSSVMEWATAIAHSISMENGGGLLLEKEQRALAEDAFDLDNERFPPAQKTPAAVKDADDSGTRNCIVFSKPIKGAILDPKANKTKKLEPITEKSQLHTSLATEDTDEVNTTFNSLDPLDVSHSMEQFANLFFVPRRNDLPVQSLRAEADPWAKIDRVSSCSSGSEVFEKASDIDASTHLNHEDFTRLAEFIA